MEPGRLPSSEDSESSRTNETSQPTEPVRKGPASFMRQTAIAMELPFGLVGPVLVGGFLGYLVDRWLGSMPIGMLVLGGLGFVAGVREVQRRMKSIESRRDGPANK